MNEPHWFFTREGRKFTEVTLPNIATQLSRIADMLALLIEIEEKKQTKPNGCCGDCTQET